MLEILLAAVVPIFGNGTGFYHYIAAQKGITVDVNTAHFILEGTHEKSNIFGNGTGVYHSIAAQKGIVDVNTAHFILEGTVLSNAFGIYCGP